MHARTHKTDHSGSVSAFIPSSIAAFSSVSSSSTTSSSSVAREKLAVAPSGNSALIVLGNYPRLDLDEPRQDLPMESRGPDGVAILRPATDAAYNPITIGSAAVEGDGAVFIKCRG